MGDAGNAGPLDNSVLTNIQITPTRTVMNITAGPIDIIVTWLSPIEVCAPWRCLCGQIDLTLPESPLILLSSPLLSLTLLWKQGRTTATPMLFRSTPMSMEASCPFPVSTRRSYSKIAEWLSDDVGDIMNWNSRVTDTIIYHEMFLESPLSFSESAQIVQDSKIYHAMLLVRFRCTIDQNLPDLFWAGERRDMGGRGLHGYPLGIQRDRQAGKSRPRWTPEDRRVRSSLALFATIVGLITGPLHSDYPVFAISVDMGQVGNTASEPVTWGVGLMRDTPIAYNTSNGTVQNRAAYWKSTYNSSREMVLIFVYSPRLRCKVY